MPPKSRKTLLTEASLEVISAWDAYNFRKAGPNKMRLQAAVEALRKLMEE